MDRTRRSLLAVVTALVAEVVAQTSIAHAASAHQINQDVDQALRTLYAAQPKARDLAKRAKAILVFPRIIKAGLLVGGQGGDGALRVGSRTVGYYNIAAASFGLQAGVQRFSYAMFFMTDAALNYLQSSNGWATAPVLVSW